MKKSKKIKVKKKVKTNCEELRLIVAIAPDPNPLERDTQMCNLTLLFHVFIRVPMYQAYQNRNQHRLLVHNSLNGERQTDREAWMHSILLNPTTTR